MKQTVPEQNKQQTLPAGFDLEKFKSELRAEVKAEVKKEFESNHKQSIDDAKKDLLNTFTEEEKKKTVNDMVVRDVKVKVLRPILVNGKVIAENEIVSVSEKEAEMFCKKVVTTYDGYGEGHYKRVIIQRAERVA